MRFVYQARDQKGDLKRGFVVAANLAKAEQLLANNGLIIISLDVQKETIVSKFQNILNRVSYKDLVVFSRQLSTLSSARVPILQSLRILESQVASKGLVVVIRNLIADVESGQSLSLAMARNPEVFGNVYISLVRSGEASGKVSESLSYLADQLEKDYELRSKVKSALTYPTFVLSALVLVGVLMFKFVLPSLIGVLKEQGAELPMVSRGLIAATDFFEVYWWLVLLVLFGGVLLLRYYVTTTPGRYMWDTLKNEFPLIGQLLQKIYGPFCPQPCYFGGWRHSYYSSVKNHQ
ncbi:type II secretion system F family protein [bacterium]|nr:MAG: type II secretion system F family protein [bacterium]